MSAIASISPWIPEDDLLLKNAVEAGASLEALAKGAVRFSRRFTVRELQDRWHSLLYDPQISNEASACMLAFELSASNLASNCKKSGISKEGTEVRAKRKLGSVRRKYYSMRKRIRGEHFSTADLSFLGAPNVNGCVGNVGSFQEHMILDNDPHEGNFMIGNHFLNHFGLQETGADILHHEFSQRRDVANVNSTCVTKTFHTGVPNSSEDNHSDGVMRKDSFRGVCQDTSSFSVKKTEKNDGGSSFEQKNAYKIISHSPGDNLVDTGKCSVVEELGPSQALPVTNLFKTDNLEEKSFSTFDSVSNDLGNICTGFRGSQRFDSPVSDGSASFHSLGFSSPLPRMPLWKMTEDISAPAMPINVNLGDEGQGSKETPGLPDEDGDCVLNFANEENLFMDVDGNDTDKSCFDNLNSLLLNSPNNSHEDDVPIVGDSFEDDVPIIGKPKSLLSDTRLAIPDGACLAESDVIDNPLHISDIQRSVCYSEVTVPPSTSVPNPHSPALHGGISYCTLNSEDPDIPSNDDIFMITFPPPVTQSIFKEACGPASFSDGQKDGERKVSLIKKDENPAKSLTGSQVVGPNRLPKISQNNPVGVRGVKSELSDGDGFVGFSRHVNNARLELGQCRSASAASKSIIDRALEEDTINAKLKELAAPATFGEHLPLHAKPDSIKTAHPEAVVKPSTSDQEKFESDDDVPYFSDVETMILEMDLCPHEKDPHVGREVSRYQYEGTKRTIIRLEQCARSSLQRAMASQGALAILYGRHLKHYIKKAEVILGRATYDIGVDIDLGREGRANKISRRQASIKMEKDGSFFLKNLGKRSISVNGKEVPTGQLISLSSSCLIEIRDMRFVFEVNHKYVKKYPF